MRGRPRRSVRSAYASILEDQVEEEPAIEDQPLVGEDQPDLDPTPEQVLQQLQT